jgi:gliding motility-associated-like protein
VKQIFCDIWVPNAFTPNGDGSNDVFRVLGNAGRMEHFGLSVYNRWGERIFHTNDRSTGWDGTYKGSKAQLGTYIYVLEYTIGGKPILQKGSFHLIR